MKSIVQVTTTSLSIQAKKGVSTVTHSRKDIPQAALKRIQE
ncbi:hypothetical protein SAMN05660742_11151 [Propionispira arboris]|uniref:Uncharacterized protein n=1 Tax=Propionispira arboris TaxID=84035 RepID=A0A1H7A0Z1_9FIRM|nr:hypothetical protein SAMN05660742_11151 [Propionispira arboris]